MKKFLVILFFSLSTSGYTQDFFTGALPTDIEKYRSIGQAPLPIGSNIPNSVDLSKFMPPVGNQYPQNSCVAWAVGYANYSYINKSINGCDYLNENTINNNCIFSPSYIYNQINGGQNRGTYFQDAFNIMQTQGIAPLSAMPYIPNNWWNQPDNNSKQIAANYKIASYWQLGQTGEDLYIESKAFLAKGIPIIISVKVDNYLKRTQNFPNPYIWNNWNGLIEQMGHAMLLVGYDDNIQAFKFINSYGTQWGNNGYGYITYNMYKKVINEAFIIQTKYDLSSSSTLLNRESKVINSADISAGLSFKVNEVIHNSFDHFPTPQEFNKSKMTIKGSVTIPANLGKTAQVVVYFYLNNQGQKGIPVGSLNFNSRTLRGQAVTGTPIVYLQKDMAFNQPFRAFMTYVDFQIPSGYPFTTIQTNLIAEPILLIDDFPVRIGELYPFFVRN